MGPDDADPSAVDGMKGDLNMNLQDYKRAGGQRVGPGDYWDFHAGRRFRTEVEAVLPGSPCTTWWRVSPLLMLLLIPTLGACFAFYLPGIGLAFTFAWLARKVAPGLVRWSAVAPEAEAAPEPSAALAGTDASTEEHS